MLTSSGMNFVDLKRKYHFVFMHICYIYIAAKRENKAVETTAAALLKGLQR